MPVEKKRARRSDPGMGLGCQCWRTGQAEMTVTIGTVAREGPDVRRNSGVNFVMLGVP